MPIEVGIWRIDSTDGCGYTPCFCARVFCDRHASGVAPIKETVASPRWDACKGRVADCYTAGATAP